MLNHVPTIKLILGQANLLKDFKSPILAAIAGTGGGKTFFMLLWLHSRMEAFPGFGWLVAEPTYQMLAKVLLNSPDPNRLDIIQYFEQAGHHPDYIAGEKIVKTDFGMIYLASADNPDTMQGAAVRGVCLDEAGLMSLQAHETAFQRRSMMAGQELLTSTPYNLGWLKTEIADKAGDLIHVEKWRSADRPGFPLEEVENARRLLAPSIFKMRYEAAFERPEGLVYQDFDRQTHIVTGFEICNGWYWLNHSLHQMRWVIAGLDWGYVAPGCILVLAEDNDKKHYIIHEEYRTGLTVDQWAVIAKNLKTQYKIEKFYCDPAEPNDIAMFQKAGLPAVAAENAVLPGINRVIEGWRVSSLFILTGQAPHLVDELESYHWNDKSIKDAPVKENDHACDALRYGLAGILGAVPIGIHGVPQTSRFR